MFSGMGMWLGLEKVGKGGDGMILFHMVSGSHLVQRRFVFCGHFTEFLPRDARNARRTGDGKILCRWVGMGLVNWFRL